MKSISINTLIIALAALVFMLVSIMIAQCMSREGVQNSSGLLRYPPEKPDITTSSGSSYEGTLTGQRYGNGTYTIKTPGSESSTSGEDTDGPERRTLDRLYDMKGGNTDYTRLLIR